MKEATCIARTPGRAEVVRALFVLIRGQREMIVDRSADGAPQSQLTCAQRSRKPSGFEAQKDSHAIQLRLEFALEVAISWGVRFDIAELRLKLTVPQ